mgnify:CR=1 FL=1
MQTGHALTELLETLKKRQLELAEEFQHYVPLVLKVAPDLEPTDIEFIASQLKQFKIDAEPDSIYNEEVNRLAAMALAAKLENGNTDSEEIIYESE